MAARPSRLHRVARAMPSRQASPTSAAAAPHSRATAAPFRLCACSSLSLNTSSCRRSSSTQPACTVGGSAST